MSRKEELEKSIKYYEEQQEIWHNKLYEAREEYAQIRCPFKVGDRLSRKHAEGVWVVTKIIPASYAAYKFYGKKIKKDGMPSDREVDLFHADYEKANP